ncbi:MAG: methyl-accepting chemotaxis protein [Phycisphaeraceae bacterium]
MFTFLKSVRGKLFFVVGLLSAVAVAVGLVGLNRMGEINGQLQRIVDVASTKQLLAARSRQALVAMHRAEKNLVLTRDAQEMDQYAAQIDEYQAEVTSNLDQIEPLATDENKKLIATFRETFQRFNDVSKQVREQSRKNTNELAYQLSSEDGRAIFDQLEQSLAKLTDRNDQEVTALIEEARAATEDAAIRDALARADDAATRALLGARVRANMVALQRAEKNFILARDQKTMQEYADAMQALEDTVQEQVAKIEQTATDENRALIASFVELKDQWLTNNDRVRELSLENSNQVAAALSAEEGRELLEESEAKLKTIADKADEAMIDDAESSRETYAFAKWLVLVTLVVGVASGVLISWYIVRGIVRGLSVLKARARQIADNDLTGEPLAVTSDDELGELTEATNRMSASLRRMVQEVTSSASEVASAATQIAASSEEMDSSTTEQSAQVSQISSAIEEMSQSVVEVARKSGDAANSAGESGRIAEEGGSVVRQTVEGMRSIEEAVTASAASVQELGKRGEQIGEIIEVINDIADQTNLLALNAAIEAARAGEHGRGFAVVADEVRKLADRTTKATEEIAGSIEAIQTETGGAVERMNAGTEQVRQGVELATGAGESLERIVASAKDVASMIQSIAAAAEEQSAASEQVSRNVDSINAVTRQASEGAGQAASAAAQLSGKAEQLQQLVGEFKLDEAA